MAASIGSWRLGLFLLQIAITLTHFEVQCANNQRKLRQAHIILRHGFRSPIVGYKKDNITEDQWPQGFGQLTERGMEQHQKLGIWLHQRYMVDNNLLNETYKRSEIWIRSSAYDRTIMSAQSCLSGLFMLKDANVLGLRWAPIPVWTEKKTADYMMSPWHSPCPRFEALGKARQENPAIKAYMEENKEFLQFLRSNTGLLENSTLEDYSYIADTIIMEVADEREVNEWARDGTVQTQLRDLLNAHVDFLFTNLSVEETSLFSGELLKEISHSFTDIVENKKHHQAHIFSGGHVKLLLIFTCVQDPDGESTYTHDTTLSALLSGLSLVEIRENPSPASCILLELYEEDGKFFVEMLYRNGTDEKDRYLMIKNCSNISCPVEEFQKFVSQFISEDIVKTCHHVPGGGTPSGNFIVAVVIISTIIVFFAVIICLVKGSKGRSHLFKKQSRFEPINFQLLGNPGSDSEDAEVFDIKDQ